MRRWFCGFAMVALAACDSGPGVSGDVGAAACAVASACGMTGDGISRCTSYVSGVGVAYLSSQAHLDAAQVRCLARAGADCEAARRCLGGGATPPACTGSSRSCSGTALSLCTTLAGSDGNRGIQQYDCASAGLMCVVGANEIDCGVGACSGLSASCAGTKLQYCAGGILREIDCALVGATCVSTPSPRCRGLGPSCAQTGVNPFESPVLRCDGASLVSCADGQEASFDCGAIKTGCFPNAKGEAFACALGNDCDPASHVASCAGNVLSYCNNGKLATLDCAAGGFRGCSPANGGACTR